ncbi:hypothetical protein ACIHIX_45825 [Streptomyces sp. NPDC051913]|uniref:hypothetical protein n=1 Tax=Streptomyces sp. NPDC051913 TaxID=3365676 RepID=UPI0037D71D1D
MPDDWTVSVWCAAAGAVCLALGVREAGRRVPARAMAWFAAATIAFGTVALRGGR